MGGQSQESIATINSFPTHTDMFQWLQYSQCRKNGVYFTDIHNVIENKETE